MFNPILNGAVYQSNGIDTIKQKFPIVEDNGAILGTIVDDRAPGTAMVATGVELNGWYFVYLMNRNVLNIL